MRTKISGYYDLAEMSFGWSARKETAIRMIVRQPFYNMGKKYK